MNKEYYQSYAKELKKNNKKEYNRILSLYEPVFDKWVAFKYYIEGISPPVCKECGNRITVSAKQAEYHTECKYNKHKYSFDKFIKCIDDDQYIYCVWNGYIPTSDNITYRCTKHGIIVQKLSSRLKGHKCQKCSAERKVSLDNFNNWKTQCSKIHNNFYDYSVSTDFTFLTKDVSIKCPIHGIFKQKANVHQSGHGCKQCSFEAIGHRLSYDTDSFIERSNNVHNNFYDYTKTIYTNIRDKVIITCPIHGDFNQIAYYHTAGHGCQKCDLDKVAETTYRSKAEIEIFDLVKSYCSDTIHSYNKFGFELDIYVPSKNLAIEYNGLYWHSSKHIETDQKYKTYHLDKTTTCEQNNIQLLHIFDNEWHTKKDIWISVIKNKLGLSNKIYARKTEIKEVNFDDAKQFAETNHLQGHAQFRHAYGLYYSDQLVSLLTIAKPRFNKNANWEIVRFCNLNNTSVIGGFSKLLKVVSCNFTGKIVSYANRRWSAGNVYEKNGFAKTSIIAPGFYYTDFKDTYNRLSFSKDKAKVKLKNYNNSVSVVENIYANGYGRIWDSGNIVYTKDL
ncbi:hypothetical protein GBBBJNDB_00154 [Pseudomonas phage Callisto]|nr:hypothetical protein GBBBJNDB_00154 [Pseudomonas phage Callisto]